MVLVFRSINNFAFVKLGFKTKGYCITIDKIRFCLTNSS